MRRLLLSASVAGLVLIGAGIGYGLRHHTVERIVEHNTVLRIEPQEKPHAVADQHRRVARRHHSAKPLKHRQPGDDSADKLNAQWPR